VAMRTMRAPDSAAKSESCRARRAERARGAAGLNRTQTRRGPRPERNLSPGLVKSSGIGQILRASWAGRGLELLRDGPRDEVARGANTLGELRHDRVARDLALEAHLGAADGASGALSRTTLA